MSGSNSLVCFASNHLQMPSLWVYFIEEGYYMKIRFELKKEEKVNFWQIISSLQFQKATKLNY